MKKYIVTVSTDEALSLVLMTQAKGYKVEKTWSTYLYTEFKVSKNCAWFLKNEHTKFSHGLEIKREDE